MTKKRILIANDAHYLGTGYGVYGKELLTRLHNTGKYEIAELCCYAKKEELDIKSKALWKTYPVVPSSQDELNRYKDNVVNAFGAFKFEPSLIDFKPDIVFDMRDYWMYSYQEMSPLRPFFKWVVMPTVDSAPQNSTWLNTFSNFDLTIPYTEWAKKTLEKQCKGSIKLFDKIANAGVNLESFVPLYSEDKKKHQKELFGMDVEITGCVMRNQKRKLFPNVLSSYRKYLDNLLAEGKTEQYNKSFLYLHTTYPEASGWNFPKLLLEHNMLNKTYFTETCASCGSTKPTKFHEKATRCKSCNNLSSILPNAHICVSSENLVKVYQSFDLFLQVAICEGFGMPQVEAASCGVPIASVDYSAMTEIVRNLEGYPIPVKTLFREIETGADRANPDNEALTNVIYSYFSMSQEEKNKKQKRTRELCEKYYSWDQVAKVWEEAIDSVDISTNLSWEEPERDINVGIQVPNNLSAWEFVSFIVLNIAKEPFLLNTSAVLNMIKDLSNGYTSSPKGIQKVDRNYVVQIFQNYLSKKKTTEALRTKGITTK
jgi:glycosyltransferase involved in cell wall biosynthesis